MISSGSSGSSGGSNRSKSESGGSGRLKAPSDLAQFPAPETALASCCETAITATSATLARLWRL